jgi:hypothetical protein
MNKRSVVIGLFLMFISLFIEAQPLQLHTKTMRLFVEEQNAPLINIYDVNTETLIKSINRGEIIGGSSHSSMSFNSDKTKLYVLGKQYANVIDVKTLETEKLQLLLNEEATLFNYNIWKKLHDAEVDRVKKEIAAGNLNATYTETPELKKMNALPASILPLGVTEKGIAVIQYRLKEKTDYLVFDLSTGGEKINTINNIEPDKLISWHNGNLLYVDQKGIIIVIDPATGNIIKKIENAFDAADLKQAQGLTKKNNHPKSIYAFIFSFGTNYFYTSLSIGKREKEDKMYYSCALYDYETGTTIYKEQTTNVLPKISPVVGNNRNKLFQKIVSINPNATNFNLLSNPAEYITNVYANLGCTQEIVSVGAGGYAVIMEDYLIFQKGATIELYDINLKKRVHTIYLL